MTQSFWPTSNAHSPAGPAPEPNLLREGNAWLGRFLACIGRALDHDFRGVVPQQLVDTAKLMSLFRSLDLVYRQVSASVLYSYDPHNSAPSGVAL